MLKGTLKNAFSSAVLGMVQGAEARMKGNEAETVKVVVRCRPMNEQETANGYKRFASSSSHVEKK